MKAKCKPLSLLLALSLFSYQLSFSQFSLELYDEAVESGGVHELPIPDADEMAWTNQNIGHVSIRILPEHETTKHYIVLRKKISGSEAWQVHTTKYEQDIPSGFGYCSNNQVDSVWKLMDLEASEEIPLSFQDFLLYGEDCARYKYYFACAETSNDPFIVQDSLLIDFCTATNIVQHDLIELDVFPNPTSRILNVQSETGIEQVNLFNLQGQEVLNRQTRSNAVKLDVSNLPPGTYLLMCHTQDGQVVSRSVQVTSTP